jgi:hypothetical protein
MHITSEPQDWTPIDSNLENELLNAHARIAVLEQFMKDTKTLTQLMTDIMNKLEGEPIYEVCFYDGKFTRMEFVRHRRSTEPRFKSLEELVGASKDD